MPKRIKWPLGLIFTGFTMRIDAVRSSSMRTLKIVLLSTFAILILSDAASAYAGPGAGISAIGTLFSIVSAFFLAIVGFVWYPIKRVLRRFRSAPDEKPPIIPSDE